VSTLLVEKVVEAMAREAASNCSATEEMQPVLLTSNVLVKVLSCLTFFSDIDCVFALISLN
jgi:hypothetical protein